MNRAFDRDRIRTSRRVGAIFSLIAVLFLVGALGLIASLNSTRSRRLSLNSNGSVSVPKLVNGQPTSKNPQGVPSRVDPRLWNARPVQAMLPLSLSSAGNATVLWVVTNTGHLLESTTAGRVWSLANPPAGVLGADALGAKFSGVNGWAVTDSGIFNTTDAGSAWTRLPALPSPPGDNVIVAWAQRLRASQGWGITNLDELVVTTNGGQSWKTVPTPPTQVEGACFASAAKGLVVTDSPGTAIYMTSDGGSTWTKVFSNTSTTARVGLNCIDSTHATVRLDLSYSQMGALSATRATNSGWQGPWRVVSANQPPSTTVSGAQGAPVSRSDTYLTAAGLVSVGVSANGTIDVSKPSAGTQALASAPAVSVGSLASKNHGAIRLFGYTIATLFISPIAGYLFAASDQSGKVALGTTRDGGQSWHLTITTIPKS